MSFLNVRRVVVAVSVVAAGVALPVASAGVASASPQRCEISMHNNGYVVGPKVLAACSFANANYSSPLGVVQRAQCQQKMLDLGVKSQDAYDACFSY